MRESEANRPEDGLWAHRVAGDCMLQFGYQRESPNRRPGIEGWLPGLVLSLTSFALVIALVYFVFIANSMRGRIPLPPATIPLAMGAAVLMAIYMFLRAVFQFRQAIRSLRSHRGSGRDRG